MSITLLIKRKEDGEISAADRKDKSQNMTMSSVL